MNDDLWLQPLEPSLEPTLVADVAQDVHCACMRSDALNLFGHVQQTVIEMIEQRQFAIAEIAECIGKSLSHAAGCAGDEHAFAAQEDPPCGGLPLDQRIASTAPRHYPLHLPPRDEGASLAALPVWREGRTAPALIWDMN